MSSASFSDNIEVTISLPQDLADWLRGYEPLLHPGSSPERLVANVAQLVCDALPEPAYVPAVGDVVTVVEPWGHNKHETVKFVDDNVVLTIDQHRVHTAWGRLDCTFTLETPAAAPQSAVEAPQ